MNKTTDAFDTIDNETLLRQIFLLCCKSRENDAQLNSGTITWNEWFDTFIKIDKKLYPEKIRTYICVIRDMLNNNSATNTKEMQAKLTSDLMAWLRVKQKLEELNKDASHHYIVVSIYSIDKNGNKK